jgi:hypothetical protein
MRRFLAKTSTCATGLAAAVIMLPSASDLALSDASDPDPSFNAAPSVPTCGSNEPSPDSEPSCGDTPRTPAEVAEARAYLVETASPGYTMTLQGPELAIGRLHPEFAIRLEHAIREARSVGLPFVGVFSAYRPPAFGVGGFSDKFNSLHTYGLAVDMRGIGSPGSPEAQLWHWIAAQNGVVCPYGPRDRAEWNHCQPTNVKIILAQNPLRETVTSAGPVDLESMFEAGNPMIEDMASAAESVSRAAPTPVRALEAATKDIEQTARVALRHQTNQDRRVPTERIGAKPARVATKTAKPAKAERLAAKSGQPAKAGRILIKSSHPAKAERIVITSSQPPKVERIAAKSGQQTKVGRVAAKSAERAKTERVAAKTAPDAKLGQRRGGRTAGAEEGHQKSKSKGA